MGLAIVDLAGPRLRLAGWLLGVVIAAVWTVNVALVEVGQAALLVAAVAWTLSGGWP